jgi:hypothetical protein
LIFTVFSIWNETTSQDEKKINCCIHFLKVTGYTKLHILSIGTRNDTTWIT